MMDDAVPEITFQELVNDFLRFGYIQRLQVVNKEMCRVILRNDVTLPQDLGISYVGIIIDFLLCLNLAFLTNTCFLNSNVNTHGHGHYFHFHK